MVVPQCGPALLNPRIPVDLGIWGPEYQYQLSAVVSYVTQCYLRRSTCDIFCDRSSFGPSICGNFAPETVLTYHWRRNMYEVPGLVPETVCLGQRVVCARRRQSWVTTKKALHAWLARALQKSYLGFSMFLGSTKT